MSKKSSVVKFRSMLQPALTSLSHLPTRLHLTRKRFLGTVGLATLVLFSALGLGPDLLGLITKPWLTPPKPVAVFNALAPRLAHYLSPDSAAKLDPLAAPVKDALAPFNEDEALRSMVARAVIQESVKQKISPSLILGIIAIENTTLNPRAKSQVGAKGLMQVMPFHAGKLGCGSKDLEAIDSNICHGVKVFAWSLKATKGDVNKALLAYNGCVKGTNTPNCKSYPRKVLAASARARIRMADSRLALHRSLAD